jgi:hypothetical protein
VTGASDAPLTSDGLPVSEHFAEPPGADVIDEPLTGTSGEIHGCDLAFWICSWVFASASVKL